MGFIRPFYSAPTRRDGDAGRDLPAEGARLGDAGRDTPAAGCATRAPAAGACRRSRLMWTDFNPADASSASVTSARSPGSSTPSSANTCANFSSLCVAPAEAHSTENMNRRDSQAALERQEKCLVYLYNAVCHQPSQTTYKRGKRTYRIPQV